MGTEAQQQERRQSWDGVLRREIDVEFRALNEDERSFEVVASTEDLDSHGDVIRQFWDLSRYEKNPVILWNHNIFESSRFSFGGSVKPEDLLPIGKGENVRVEAKKLKMKVVLLKGTPEQEPFIDKLWRRIQQGVQRAVSVGFRPGQVTRILKGDGSTDHFELGSEERPNELRELSLVPMGSNPEAVAKSIAFEHEHLRQLADDAAERGNEETMTEEEKKALEQAKADLAVAQNKAKEAEERAKDLDAQLTAEKATTAKLEKDLGAAHKSLADVSAKLAKTELDRLQGVKFAPAEREELDKLVADIGLERTVSLLEKRNDLALTTPVTDGEGNAVADKNKGAPPPVEDGGHAGSDILKTIDQRVSA